MRTQSGDTVGVGEEWHTGEHAGLGSQKRAYSGRGAARLSGRAKVRWQMGQGVQQHRGKRRPTGRELSSHHKSGLTCEENVCRTHSLICSLRHRAGCWVLGSTHTSSPSGPGKGRHQTRAFEISQGLRTLSSKWWSNMGILSRGWLTACVFGRVTKGCIALDWRGISSQAGGIDKWSGKENPNHQASLSSEALFTTLLSPILSWLK